MITFLNKKQLAFILDIKPEEARAKMCVAHCKALGIDNTAEINEKNKVVDKYPEAMKIEMLAAQLNLPTLQEMVNDIHDNYLTRPAAKKWILCDYPEKKIKAMNERGEKKKVPFPPALKSLLPDKTVKAIESEWLKRYPKYA